MSKTPAPMPKVEWEPTLSGINLHFIKVNGLHYGFEMPMTSVRELRDDMEEAMMHSRGTEKIDCMSEEVEQFDKVVIAGNIATVASVLTNGHYEVILQFSEPNIRELILPTDEQITVWRAVE